jgi:hypothetical protein
MHRTTQGGGAIMPDLGRPTNYKPEYCQAIVEFMSQGFSATAFAASIGQSKSVIQTWANAHIDFMEAKKRAETACEAWWEDLGKRGSEGRVRGFNVGSWIFTMKNRFGWKDNLAISSDQDIAILTAYDHR